MTHAKQNIGLATEFEQGTSKLSPIIFSHGLTSNRCLHNVTGCELASFGHIVFVIDHCDGSGSYTEDVRGNQVKFNTSLPRDQFLPGQAG